ncbi:DUF2357 domain-containing protein [Bacillus alkalicellulosilyticus]|uniref:DUF2357 domain-containing protein n=1 Tax=Alkalihalobacterium alkalicellulosilyticum TaxID=1912214 RepID=UPI000998AD30|nr:DUF2357 domain-containing protein [Bacillus alkalicellulosilyticus]
MEPLNFGDDVLEVHDVSRGWIPFQEGHFIESTDYKLRYHGEQKEVLILGLPWPFYKKENKHMAQFTTPFQSGVFEIRFGNQTITSYIYPDDRKMTEQQYDLMLTEILEESNSCFQRSGLTVNVDASGKMREMSWTQWSYIERAFHQLKQIVTKVMKQPIRRLEKQVVVMQREKVQRVEKVTMHWLDKAGYGIDIPKMIQTDKTFETVNVFENQVVKQQLYGLYRLLTRYETIDIKEVADKAKIYKTITLRWLNSSFFQGVSEHEGPYTITQKFRKHPVYRLWYQWFTKLYQHSKEGIGLSYPIPLKDTFQLYEMWCYMKVVKVLREANMLEDTSDLYRQTKDGLFLNLAENYQSRVKLKGGNSLYFQRTYQYNSNPYYTFTQRMIPDIVLEGEKGIIVFDPKYRVSHNLGTALGEMHKYRDGILHRESGERAVRAVYILTPTKSEDAETMRYFQDTFLKKHQMGAYHLLPGVENEELEEQILKSMK